MKVIPTFIQEAREALSMVAKTCAGHYHYDIHGNVDTLLQDNQQLSVISSVLQPQRFKKIIYDFDLISGNVNLVSYQDGEPDAFYHFYEYDADNRIIAVYSSNYPQKNALININTVSNSPLWDNDAKYFYYAHGPLARVEYGDNKVQGQDYAYTLQGWIKGVNSNTLDTLRDIGKDGAIGSVNSIFAKDAFGYTLNYHTNDYKAIDGLKWNTATNRFESIVPGSDLNNSRNDLFNGNITSMVTTIVPPTLPKSDSVAFSPLPQGTAYRYDQLNRLVEMKAWQNLNTATNTWGSGLIYNGMYNNKFTYDANGSMLTAMANNQVGQTIDKQIYHHQTINGRKFSNRTYAITDSATITSGNDLLNQTAFTDNADSINSFNNYSYTEIGERKSNKQDSIDLITWTVYGKIDSIARVSGSSKYNLKFDYDASYKRIAKHVYTSNNIWLYTEYYIRDAQGNLMSTYLHQVIDSTATVSFAQTEKEIYGSSELGIDVTKIELIGTLPVSNIFIRTLDNKHYTGCNHLGNVLTTFTDRKLPIDADNNGIVDEFLPDVVASNDYMPFGALLTERTFKKGTFPNSFNGKRDDAEIKAQNYGMREYGQMERELGWRVDQLTRQYPFWSPYQFAGNNPIEFIDLDGGEIMFPLFGDLPPILETGVSESIITSASKSPIIEEPIIQNIGRFTSEQATKTEEVAGRTMDQVKEAFKGGEEQTSSSRGQGTEQHTYHQEWKTALGETANKGLKNGLRPDSWLKWQNTDGKWVGRLTEFKPHNFQAISRALPQMGRYIAQLSKENPEVVKWTQVIQTYSIVSPLMLKKVDYAIVTKFTYQVQKGDNLTKIAKAYGTTVENLAKLNNISDPNKIKVGSSLTVKVTHDKVPSK